MKLTTLALVLLLSAGVAPAAKWGYMVNESDMSTFQALAEPTWQEVQAAGPVLGVVPDVARVIAAANQTEPYTWQINETTYWKSWNNMQWHMKPYPALPFQSPEIPMSHITIWHASGDFYLVGATRA